MEVCVDCVESAVNAERGGAARLELCSALSEGGLTPTPGLLKAVSSAVNIPIYCMLRPRRGADFVFSCPELEAMKTDALILRAVGRVDGFVFGALTEERQVDINACQEIVHVTAPLPITFHRAIDVCVDPLQAITTISKLGFRRILTSGQEENAEKGIPMIKKMVQHAGNSISIMVGAGITKDNIAHILRETGAKEYHGSARKMKPLTRNTSFKASMGPADTSECFVTDTELVAETISAAKCCLNLHSSILS